MLRALDPAKDNLADNEEIQVSLTFRLRSRVGIIFVYRSCTALAWLCALRLSN